MVSVDAKHRVYLFTSWSGVQLQGKGEGVHLHEHSGFTTSSLRGWVVPHYGGLPPGWSFIRLVFHQVGLSSGWLLTRAVSRGAVLQPVVLEDGWSLIMAVSHPGGLSSGWLLMRVVSWGVGWGVVWVVFHEVGA